MREKASPHPNADVRMRGFQQRSTVEQAIGWLDQQLARLAPLPTDQVLLQDAAGRVLADSIASQIDVPQFQRAMMDGFALQAADIQGASSDNRLPLQIIGDCFPGKAFDGTLRQGQAVRIMTGAALPDGADAVLPAERTEVATDTVFALGDLPAGKHVGTIGEDITAGTTVLPAGRRLRPQDLGVLSSIGCNELTVKCRPRVRILITGDELLPAGTPAVGCQIADANGPMLTALVARDGGHPLELQMLSDDRDAILAAMQSPADVVLVSGGSSVGQEDYAPTLLAAHGTLGIHGISMRPGSPTGFGTLGDTAGNQRLVFLLPGNPVSCLCAYDFFAGRAIRTITGRNRKWPYREVRGHLTRKLISAVGRLDYARVKVNEADDGQLTVEPIAISGSSVLSSTTRAEGFVVIPASCEGHTEGSEVDVFLYG